MKRGQNSVSIACTLELINLIKSHAGKEKMNEGFWLIRELLTKNEAFKAEFIEEYGKEGYEKTVAHYSKTNLEQRKDRELKQKEREIRQQARFEIEKLKAEAYAEQVGLGEEVEEEPKLSERDREKLQKEKDRIKKLLVKARAHLKSEPQQKNRGREKFIEEYEGKLHQVEQQLSNP